MKEKTKDKKQKINIWFYLKDYKWWIALYVLLTILAGACSILMTILLANVIEIITQPDFLKKALIYMAIIIGLTIFQRGCYYFLNIVYFKCSNKIMATLNLDLAKQAFKLNSKTYNSHDTGAFVQRIVEDPAQIVDNLVSVVDMIMSIMTALIMLIYISTLNIWVALMFVFLVVVAGLIETKRVVVRRKNRWITRKKHDGVHSLTTEIVRSEKDIKSLGLEEKLSQVSGEKYEDYRKQRYKTDKKDVDFWSTRNLIINLGTLLVVVFAIWLMDKGLITLAAFMLIYSNRDSLWNLIYSTGNLSNTFVNIKVCQKRMFSLFDEDEFETEKFGTKHVDNLIGDVEFKNVSFTFREYEYKSVSAEDFSKKNKNNKYIKNKKLVSENKIFNKLCFKIEPNTTVAFVGKSGSGKSTILNLLTKMYDVDSGKILVGGVDIKTLDKESLRKNISLVNQFPYIFDMTIKENLILAKPEASEEELKLALQNASLWEFVDSLPKGIETKVGEGGIKLSGGQKQRLAIARALLRNSNILIFDESTSSLDNFAQNDIKATIDNLKGTSTIVIVAHRLSTIKDVDKIFFLDAGVIVDEGTFDELFERNKVFKSMFLAENI